MIYEALRQHDTSLNRDFARVSHGLQIVRQKENFRATDRQPQPTFRFHGLADTGTLLPPDTLIAKAKLHHVQLNNDVDFEFMSMLTEADALYYLYSHCERCGRYINGIFGNNRLGGLCKNCAEVLEGDVKPKPTFSTHDDQEETLHFRVSQYDAERYYAGNAWFE